MEREHSAWGTYKFDYSRPAYEWARILAQHLCTERSDGKTNIVLVADERNKYTSNTLLKAHLVRRP